MLTFLYNLTILYIGLKLAGVTSWSWFAVLSPLGVVFLLTLMAALAKIKDSSK